MLCIVSICCMRWHLLGALHALHSPHTLDVVHVLQTCGYACLPLANVCVGGHVCVLVVLVHAYVRAYCCILLIRRDRAGCLVW